MLLEHTVGNEHPQFLLSHLTKQFVVGVFDLLVVGVLYLLHVLVLTVRTLVRQVQMWTGSVLAMRRRSCPQSLHINRLLGPQD